MDFIYEKIRVMTDKLDTLRLLDQQEVPYTFIPCPEYKITNTPPALTEDWQPYTPNYLFEGVDTHYWLHLTLQTPKLPADREARLRVKTGREGQWDATNPQFTVYVDGVTTQALDTNHTWLPLESDREYDIYFYVYTGMTGGHFEIHTTLETVDLKIEALYYDVLVPYESLAELTAGSLDYLKTRDALDKALMLLDLRHVYSEDFYESVDAVLAWLKTNYYETLCGNSETVVSCVGHTHIDVAWLWTVAQTKEKAQRSFSTVLNLMRRYPEFIFMSSQPQLYQHVKDNDPALYEEIKQAVKDDRWETEGAMWLEADTNLISGESLIRQILYGKRFMKEEFGVDSKILWLPDVFGYSGALPQILKKCGVDQFFTAKMGWSESNKLPHDTFLWEGIDGSRVFTSLIDGYVRKLNPHELKITWDNYKDKSYTTNTLLTCGFGDGGGGTTYEMLEQYKRLKYGLPGIPKARMEKAGTFFANIQKDFEKNAEALKKTPRWKGEMYLEMHRGTYTSIAKNKRNNRKSELLYLKAETLAAIDQLLNGGAYPSETIRRNTTNILLNQFHDIIPGSSIRQVYEVTDEEYARIREEGQAIVNEKLQSIQKNLKTEGGIFVYNPTPFPVSRYITHGGSTYFADDVPAHGWKVIAPNPVDCGITVTDHSIENDLVKVTFNASYHIVSVYDKEEQRELISHGQEANRLEVFEDYPRDYDAWEITDYYKQKMWLADHVEQVTPLKNGLRIHRRYQYSLIYQDIVLTRGSRRVDFITTVDWQEDHVLLKAAFPVDIHSTRATYDIQFGNLERPTHQNTSWDAAKFEVCAHKWADLSEGDYGVSLLNNCKYGYSIEDNVMKLSLLKAATYPNPEADRGFHRFTYSLYPHKGDFRAGDTVKEGYFLNCPLDICPMDAAKGTLPDSFSMISCPQKNIVVETIKKAEEDDSVVVRFYDAWNQKTQAQITAGFDFREVYLCDMLENSLEKLEQEGRRVTVPVKNYEIVTLKFI